MGKQTEDAGFSEGQHQQTAANESPEKPSTPDTTIEMTDVNKQLLRRQSNGHNLATQDGCFGSDQTATTWSPKTAASAANGQTLQGKSPTTETKMLASYCHKPALAPYCHNPVNPNRPKPISTGD